MANLIDMITYNGKHYKEISDAVARREIEKLADKLKPIEDKILSLCEAKISICKHGNTHVFLFPDVLKADIIELFS